MQTYAEASTFFGAALQDHLLVPRLAEQLLEPAALNLALLQLHTLRSMCRRLAYEIRGILQAYKTFHAITDRTSSSVSRCETCCRSTRRSATPHEHELL